MKALFLTLTLLNVLFFFWEYHLGALNPVVQSPSSLPGLLLLSERETARRGSEISGYLDGRAAQLQTQYVKDIGQHLATADDKSWLITARQPERPPQPIRRLPPVYHCYEAGPFVDQAEMQRQAKAAHIGAFKAVTKEVVTSTDFQVYSPPAKDAEQARINKLTLLAKGFTDVWPVLDGELKGAISLGVFNDRQRATLFKSQLAERGVKAEIRQRSKLRSDLFMRFTANATAIQNLAYTRLPNTECGNALK